ncbi:MAG: hypothetical protein QM631_16410 [Dysgonomonas sp.]
MTKYGAELTEKIVILIEDGLFTVSQICEAANISCLVFYSWMDTKEEFRQETEPAMVYRRTELMMLQALLEEKRKTQKEEKYNNRNNLKIVSDLIRLHFVYC